MSTNDKGGKPENYIVGYGKPPDHTQFKPGQSGNPHGRRKGSKNYRTIVGEIMSCLILHGKVQHCSAQNTSASIERKLGSARVLL